VDIERYALVHVPANVVMSIAALRAAAVRLGESAETLAQNRSLAADPPKPGRHGFAPIVVCDASSKRAAEKALLASLRKPQDGWTSTHLNRPISLLLTRWLVTTALTPNQLSVAILGIGLLGAALAAKSTYAAQLAGAMLFQAQSVLDGCDGE